MRFALAWRLALVLSGLFATCFARADSALRLSQNGASLSVSWDAMGAGVYLVTVLNHTGAAVDQYWCYGTSTDLTLPSLGDYTIEVAAPGQSPETGFASLLDYPAQRELEPYFPLNDTTKTTIAFSVDWKSQDYAYYLQIYSQAGSIVFQDWVYSATTTIPLDYGAYSWRATPIARENDGFVLGTASPWIYFNVRTSVTGMEDLLGSNPLNPSDPLRTPLLFPEDAVRLPDGRWVVSDTNHSVLKVLDEGDVSVLAGTGIAGFNGDGPASTTKLNRPTGLAVDPDGNLIFCDTGSFLIRKLNINTLVVTTLYGVPGMLGSVQANGDLNGRRLGYLKLIAYHEGTLYATMQLPNAQGRIRSYLYAFDRGGINPTAWTARLGVGMITGFDWYGANLYLTYVDDDNNDCRLVRIDSTGSATTECSAPLGSIGVCALGDDDVLFGGKEILFEFKNGQRFLRNGDYVNIVCVARVDDGDFVVVDSDAGRVASEDLSTFAETSVIRNGSNSFGCPACVIPEDATHLLILNNHPARLFRFNTVTGETALIAGNGGLAFGAQGIDARTTSIRYPNSVAEDAAGNIYVSEQAGIDVIDRATNLISVYAGAPRISDFVDHVGLRAARFHGINGLAFDSNGNLVVSDSGNYRVRLIRPNSVDTVAGNGLPIPVKYDVTAIRTSTNRPQGAIPYGGGYVIPQRNRNSISRVDAGGILYRLAGVDVNTNYQGNGEYLDAPDLEAYFNTPVSIVPLSDPWDFLVCDEFNGRIRRVNTFVSTVLGDGQTGYSPTTLNLPNFVTVLNGEMYVADLGNGLVRSFPVPH